MSEVAMSKVAMSEVMLNVADSERTVHGSVPGCVALRLVAALSSDPMTIDDLEQALGRYQEVDRRTPGLGSFQPGVSTRRRQAGVVCIDLAARRVASENSCFLPSRHGVVQWHDGSSATDIPVPFCLDDDWIIIDDVGDWYPTISCCQQQRGKPPCPVDPSLDVRTVIYDKLASFVVPAVRAAAGSRRQAIPEIHTRWLMSPRDDLQGKSPRDVMLRCQEHIDRDIEHQAIRWSRVGKCPPGVLRQSPAFRLAGWGTNEIVLYYDLVRYLLEVCWDRVKPVGEFQRHASSLPVEVDGFDFGTAIVDMKEHSAAKAAAGRAALLVDERTEVAAIAKLQQEWLHWPEHPQLSGRTPVQIIATERARLPVALFGKEAMIDCDCPICQAMVADDKPVFLHSDASHMEDDFAFSLYQTLDQWESERRDFEAYAHWFGESSEARFNDKSRSNDKP